MKARAFELLREKELAQAKLTQVIKQIEEMEREGVGETAG